MKNVMLIVTLMNILSSMSLYTYSWANGYSNSSNTGNTISGTSNDSFYPLFNQLSSSVVQVIGTINSSSSAFNPQAQNTTSTEVGAGFIYDNVGHIITANHILGGANKVNVVFKDGDRFNATVVGRDGYTDVAVLDVSDLPRSSGGVVTSINQSLKPVILADSSALRIGDRVATIGYPFAAKIAMTSGIVSQTGYLLYFPPLGYPVPDAIETDVAVNPGNSGSPLVNINGEVVGLIYGRLNPTTAPLGEFSGLSVAIPSNTIKRVIPSLIQNGIYIHPYAGIVGSTLTIDLAKHFKNIPDNLSGVLVNSIVRGGSADRAGINATTTNRYGERQLGDIITALDGKKISDIEGLLSYIQQKSVGEKISFTVYRSGEYLNLTSNLQPLNLTK